MQLKISTAVSRKLLKMPQVQDQNSNNNNNANNFAMLQSFLDLLKSKSTKINWPRLSETEKLQCQQCWQQ